MVVDVVFGPLSEITGPVSKLLDSNPCKISLWPGQTTEFDIKSAYGAE